MGQISLSFLDKGATALRIYSESVTTYCKMLSRKLRISSDILRTESFFGGCFAESSDI